MVLCLLLQQLAGSAGTPYCDDAIMTAETCTLVCLALVPFLTYDEERRERFVREGGSVVLASVIEHGCWIGAENLGDRCRDHAMAVLHTVSGSGRGTVSRDEGTHHRR